MQRSLNTHGLTRESSSEAAEVRVQSILPDGGAPSSAANLRGHLIKGCVRLAVLVGSDSLAVLAARSVLRGLRRGLVGDTVAAGVSDLFPQGVVSGSQFTVALIVGMSVAGAYRSGKHWTDHVRILAAVGIGTLLVVFGDLWQGDPTLTAFRGLVIWGGMGVVVRLERQLLGSLAHRFRAPTLDHHVLEVRGRGAQVGPANLGPRYRTVGVLSGEELPADIEDMQSWLSGGVDTLVVSGEIDVHDFGRLTDFALVHGCRLLCLPRSAELDGVESRRIWIEGRPFSELNAPGLRAYQLLIKRIVDIVVAGSLVLLFSPLFIVLAVGVKMSSRGPVFFMHRRAGIRGRFFHMIKFRTMRSDAEEILQNDGALYLKYVENDFKLAENEDPRITSLGRFLRRTSLDELPQLLNVLRGDMSLVGPRPVVEAELSMYADRIRTFLSVKPGVTGFWQVSGRSRIAFPERAELDLAYIRTWSLLSDFLILLRTVPAVLFQRGAH